MDRIAKCEGLTMAQPDSTGDAACPQAGGDRESSSTMEAIDQALELYRTAPMSWWPTSLINEIQRINPGLSIPWLAGCLLDLLPRRPRGDGIELEGRIRRTVESESSEEIGEFIKNYNLLYSDIRGDEFFLGYARLLRMKQLLLVGDLREGDASEDIREFRTLLVWSFILIGESGYARETHIQFVIDNFLKALASSPEGTIGGEGPRRPA